MNEPSDTAKAVARAAASAFGSKPKVHEYLDEAEKHSIALLSCSGRPSKGLVSYSTVGLHGVPNEMDGKDIRVEVAGVAPATMSQFANLMSTAALYVMKDGWLAAPGVVFPDLVDGYALSKSLRHLIWFEPFPWPELSCVELDDDQTVHWLLGVPISDSERELVEDGGFEELEGRFVEGEVDFHDLDRDPVV